MGSEPSLPTNKETLPVREADFDLLRELGINTIFGNPGSTELAFLTPGRRTYVTFWRYKRRRR
jgi:thiamine pyrophosphate-dependent acetolactate synthase large subunit-like protein